MFDIGLGRKSHTKPATRTTKEQMVCPIPYPIDGARSLQYWMIGVPQGYGRGLESHTFTAVAQWST
jgi:hypothetical protein